MELLIGKRAKISTGSEEQFVTIRFYGQVPPDSGKYWIGVEWDDVKRGKHSGCHEGREYFKCRCENAGSFIRYDPVKFKSLFQLGRTVGDALRVKYTDKTVEDVVDTFGDTRVKVEMFGFEKVASKQTNFDALCIVGLADLLVSEAGDLNGVLPSVCDLDLSRNLISDWGTVASICAQLPKLQSLRLNLNRLEPPLTDVGSISDYSALNQLTTLSLQNTLTSWGEILAVGRYLDNLRELHMGYNNLNCLNVSNCTISDTFKNLKLLNLESNQLSDWADIEQACGHLCQLEVLFLQGNPLAKISISNNSDNQTFKNLKVLNITNTLFETLESMADIDNLPALEELRCTQLSKLTLPYSQDKRLRTAMVGIFSNIKSLNGSPITKNERADLELFYVKLCREEMARRRSVIQKAQQQQDGEPTRKEMQLELSQFVRYERLLKEYELPADGEIEIKVEPTTLKDNLIDIKFRNDGKTVEKSVPANTTIRVIRTIIMRLFRIPVSKQSIQLKSFKSGSCIAFNSDLLETRELRFYSDEMELTIEIEVIY